MIEKAQISDNHKSMLQEIEYLKSLVDDIYTNKIFFTFSLQTLELTRRFNNSYKKFKEDNSSETFQELRVLGHNLELRILQEN